MSQPTAQIKTWKSENNWQRILSRYGTVHEEQDLLWQDDWVVSQVGFAASQLGQYALAKQYYDQQIHLAPEDANAYYNRAYIAYAEGMDTRDNEKYREALNYGELALEYREDFIPCHLVMGNCYRRLEKYREAADHYTTVCRDYQEEDREFQKKFYRKHYVKACFGLAKALLELKKPDLALRAATECRRQDTTDIIAPVFHHYLQGEIYRQLGDLDQALQSYNQAKSCHSGKEWIHDRLGRIRSDQVEFDQAEKHFQTALQTRRQGYIYIDQAINYLRAGKYSNALQSLEQALPRSRKSHHKIRLIQARVYMAQKQYSRAVQYYEQAIQKKLDLYAADYPLAMWELGLAHQALGEKAEADQYLEEVQYAYPHTLRNALDAETCFSGGVVYV